MICQRCHTPVHIVAPFCPTCGADPVLGADWLATSPLSVDEQGRAILSAADGRLEDVSLSDLLTVLTYHANRIAHAERASVETVMAWKADSAEDENRRGLRAQAKAAKQRDAAFREASEAAFSLIAEYAPALSATAEAIVDNVNQKLTIEEFRTEHVEAAWVLDEYGAYVQSRTEAELRDVVQRRTTIHLSRRGFTDVTSFGARQQGFAMAYDQVALTPLPPQAVQAREFIAGRIGGYEGSFGELALALVPAAWRFFEDSAMAPSAIVAVFVQQNPLAGIAADDPDWAGDRAGARAHYAEWLGGDDADAGTVRPATICGLPAVRSQWMEPIGKGVNKLIDLVWVKGPQATYHVAAWAPDQSHELVRAVHAALASFLPADGAMARDSAPMSASAARGARGETGDPAHSTSAARGTGWGPDAPAAEERR